MNKVRHGTPQHGDHLCPQCSNYGVREHVDGRIFRHCGAFETPITSPVARCSSFADAKAVSVYAMKEIAWTLATNVKTGKLSFFSPNEFRQAVESGKVGESEQHHTVHAAVEVIRK